MPKKINIIGRRFGRLVVLSYSHSDGYRKYYNCQCDCGNQTCVLKGNLLSGKQVSCGCFRRFRLANENRLPDGYLHLGKIFRSMKYRCYDKSCNRYYRYGGRGIKICDEWLSDINSFRKWAIENGYKEGLSIDRIDNDKDYCPENCRWVTQEEQRNNTSRTVLIEYNGKTQTLTQWAKELNMKPSTLHNRIRVRGWSIEHALTQPVRKRT